MSQEKGTCEMDRMRTQSEEFEAMEELYKAWRALRETAVVDDDYMLIRSRYEMARVQYVEAMKKNGRSF